MLPQIPLLGDGKYIFKIIMVILIGVFEEGCVILSKRNS